LGKIAFSSIISGIISRFR